MPRPKTTSSRISASGSFPDLVLGTVAPDNEAIHGIADDVEDAEDPKDKDKEDEEEEE